MKIMDIETNFPDIFSWQTYVDELREKGTLMLEGINKRKDGSIFPVEANVSYVGLTQERSGFSARHYRAQAAG